MFERITKLDFTVIVGLVGGFFGQLFGGMDTMMRTVIIFMVTDFLINILSSMLLGNSKKTESGKLKSDTMGKGIIKKVMLLLMILIANQLDIVLGLDYIRYTVCIGLIFNELTSILETWSISGLKYPRVLDKILDILDNKQEEGGGQA